MPAARKMTEQIMKKAEESPKYGPLLLRMPEKDRADIYGMLEYVSGLICGNAEENIKHHIDDKCVTKEELEAREEYYMEVLNRSNGKLSKELRELLVELITRVTDEHRKTDEERAREIETLAMNDRRQQSEIDLLRAQGTQTALKVDKIEAQTSSLPHLSEQLNNMDRKMSAHHDSINIAISAKNFAPKKQNPISHLSTKKLLLVGVGIAIGFAIVNEFLFTGQSTIWQAAAKFLGVGL